MVEMGRKHASYVIGIVIFFIIILAAVIFYSAGAQSIIGDVTLNQHEYRIITPFGFNLAMLVIGAFATMLTVLIVIKEGQQS